jgi:hypothetical protein
MLGGAGYWLWQCKNCEGGDAQRIAATARAAGLGHALVKIADGSANYNVSVNLKAIIQALQGEGLRVYGWHYIYGDDPTAEANRAIRNIYELGVDGYVVDAEAEFKKAGKAQAARAFMQHLRASFPDLDVGLSSYRFPEMHPEFPWTAFREYASFDLPQVYWMGSHNPGAQLAQSMEQFSRLTPRLPYIPAGSAFRAINWAPTADDLVEFMTAAQAAGLPAVNFWEWAETRNHLPALWDVVAGFGYPNAETPPPDPEPEPEEGEMSDVIAQIQAIKDVFPDAVVSITVNLGGGSTPGDDPGGEPGDAPAVKYRVDTTGKGNNRVKVRPTPGAEAHDYVYQEEIVGGPGRELNGHYYIEWREGDPVIPGYVEKQYLARI